MFLLLHPIVELEIRMVIPLERILLCRMVLAILGYLSFQMKLSVVLSISVKNGCEFLMWNALDLLITFGKMAICTVNPTDTMSMGDLSILCYFLQFLSSKV